MKTVSIPSPVIDSLRSLPYHPASPITGRGNVRVSFPLLTNFKARSLWPLIPERHKYESRYGGILRYVSPEAADACEQVLAAIKAENSARWQAKLHSPEVKLSSPEAKCLPTVSRDRRAPVSVNLDNLAQSGLSGDEQQELAALLSGACHPFTGRALELKHKSGLTWGQIQA